MTGGRRGRPVLPATFGAVSSSRMESAEPWLNQNNGARRLSTGLSLSGHFCRAQAFTPVGWAASGTIRSSNAWSSRTLRLQRRIVPRRVCRIRILASARSPQPTSLLRASRRETRNHASMLSVGILRSIRAVDPRPCQRWLCRSCT